MNKSPSLPEDKTEDIQQKPDHPLRSIIRKYLYPPLRRLKYFLLRYPQSKKKNQRDPNAEIPRVLIVGRNYSSNLSLARSFGIAGYEVEVLRTYQRRRKLRQLLMPETYSRYVKAYHICVLWSREIRLINKLIYLAEPGKRMMLIPSDDQAVDIIDRNLNVLSEYYLIPSIRHQEGEISRFMDKQYQKKQAARYGVPVVNGCVIKAENGIFDIPDSVRYPCFVKPNISIRGRKTAMKTCWNKEELSELIVSLSADKEVELLVEDHLFIDKEYSLLGLSTGEETIAPGFFVTEKSGHYSHRGVALMGTVLDPKPYRDLIDKITAFISSLGYQGLFDVDLIRATDGSFYFAEINFRYGGSGYAITASGLNLPGMFADYILKGIPVDTDCTINEFNKTFLSDMILYDEYRFGYLTERNDMRKLQEEADIRFIYDEDDPGPYRNFTLMNELLIIKQHLKKMKDSIFPKKEGAGTLNDRILICGLNYGTNLCMARSFGEAGYPVEILRIFWEKKPLRRFLCPEAFSRYTYRYHTIHANKDKDALLNRLLKLSDPSVRTLLIPADDLIIAFVDEHYDILSKHYVIPNIDRTQGKIIYHMHKDIQKELAASCGLRTAESRLLKPSDGKYVIPEDISYPCFIKPDMSADRAKTLTRRCESREELKAFLDALADEKTEFLVEKYLDIDKELSFIGIAADNKIIIPALLEIDRGGHGERRGVAISGIIRNSGIHQDVVECLCEFVRKIGYVGLFDIDMVQAKDNHIYFLEMNFRYGASGRALDRCGLNLPGLLADHLLEGGSLFEKYGLRTDNLRYVNDRVLVHEYVTGYITKDQMNEIKKTAQVSFFSDPKDPWPYRYFCLLFSLAGPARLLYKLLKRH